MIKRLLLLVNMLVSLLFSSSSNIIDKPLKQDLYSSVLVRIKLQVKTSHGEIRKGMAGCSGTYVSETEVLTAGHCVENDPKIKILHIWIRGVDGKSFTATVKKVDYKKDLALLEVYEGRHKHGIIKIADNNPKIGEDIRAIGSPLGLEFLVSKGVVSELDFKTKEFDSKYIVHDAMINPGSSGGGLFNMNGELVGVNTMTVGIFGWMGISMAVSTQDVHQFLRK